MTFYLASHLSHGCICLYMKAATNCFYLAVQGKVCGLCGDFDGDGQNDFTTQGQLPVSNPVDFANSWKVSSSCPDVENSTDPCVLRPNRLHWAKRMCSIITGETFKDCHSKVMMGVILRFCYVITIFNSKVYLNRWITGHFMRAV